MPVDRAESGSSRRRSSIHSAKSKRTSPNEIHDGKFVRHHPDDLTSKEKHKSFSTAMALERAGATEKKTAAPRKSIPHHNVPTRGFDRNDNLKPGAAF